MADLSGISYPDCCKHYFAALEERDKVIENERKKMA